MAAASDNAFCDRAARDLAGGLILRFRDGEIGYDMLESQWPRETADYSLKMLLDAAWGAFEQRGDEISKQWPFSREEHDLLTRMALFAASDLSYEWPHPPVATLSSGLGWPLIAFSSFILLLILGNFGWVYPIAAIAAVIAVNAFLRHRHARRSAKMTAAGDIGLWPFRQTADLETVRNRSTYGEPL